MACPFLFAGGNLSASEGRRQAGAPYAVPQRLDSATQDGTNFIRNNGRPVCRRRGS